MSDADKPSLDSLRIDRSQSRRTSKWPLVLILLVVAGGAGVFFKFRNQPNQVITSVVIEQSSGNGSMSSGTTVLNASGYVNARRKATVSSKTTGKIVEVLVEEGMKVQKGDVLARLDTTNIDTSFRLAEAQLESAKSSIAETEVRFTQARRDFHRTKKLIDEQIASESDFDFAEAEVKSLQARLLRQKADVGVAQRQLEFFRQQLDDLVIRAPFAGVVVSKDAQPGEMISPVSAGGGFTRTGICTVVDMNSIEIEVDVNEAYINRVVADQSATAILDAYPEWEIPASVIAIIPTADRQKATVKVRIAFNETDERILPDMGVKVAFQESREPSVGSIERTRKLRIPAAAIRSGGADDFVWMLVDGEIKRRAVKVSGREADSVLIGSGLSAGETVILDASDELKEGQSAIQTNP